MRSWSKSLYFYMLNLLFDGSGDAQFVTGKGTSEVKTVFEIAAVHYYLFINKLSYFFMNQSRYDRVLNHMSDKYMLSFY